MEERLKHGKAVPYCPLLLMVYTHDPGGAVQPAFLNPSCGFSAANRGAYR